MQTSPASACLVPTFAEVALPLIEGTYADESVDEVPGRAAGAAGFRPRRCLRHVVRALPKRGSIWRVVYTSAPTGPVPRQCGRAAMAVDAARSSKPGLDPIRGR